MAKLRPALTILPRSAPIEVAWDGRLPHDVRAAVEPYVARWSLVLPREFQALAVRMERASADRAVGAAAADPEYRQGRIEITEHYMSQSDLERERTVLHELLHITLRPLRAEVEGLISDQFDDPENDPYISRFSRAYANTEESVIQSIVFGLLPSSGGEIE